MELVFVRIVLNCSERVLNVSVLKFTRNSNVLRPDMTLLMPLFMKGRRPPLESTP